MKQNITIEQLNELNDDEIVVLNNWMIEKGYYKQTKYTYKNIASQRRENGMKFSIGQMIEFIQEHNGFKSYGDMYTFNYSKKGELCDALWNTVKEILCTK
jgi:hypothetical protein